MSAPVASGPLQSLTSYPGQESNSPRKHSGKQSLRTCATRTATHFGDERLQTIIAAWDRLPEAVKDELAHIVTGARKDQ
jgi:hypothetical protein